MKLFVSLGAVQYPAIYQEGKGGPLNNHFQSEGGEWYTK